MPQGLEIDWSTRAVTDMRRLAARDRERIIGKIEQYASDPASLAAQVTALTGSAYLRLRVGNYRVIFGTYYDERARMLILRVRHRREAYGS